MAPAIRPWPPITAMVRTVTMTGNSSTSGDTTRWVWAVSAPAAPP